MRSYSKNGGAGKLIRIRLLYFPTEKHQFGKITSIFRSSKNAEDESKTRKMALSSKSLAGPGYIVLNGIRVMNVIGLMAVVTASVVMLVKTSVSSKFFFFDAVTHVLTAITSSEWRPMSDTMRAADLLQCFCWHLNCLSSGATTPVTGLFSAHHTALSLSHSP